MPAEPSGQSVTITCPAKVNLTLAVGGPRADGLHPIASVMIAVEHGDKLTIEPIAQGPSRFDRAWSEDAPRPTPIDWAVEDDLIFRAHALMENAAGKPLPIHAALTKWTPVGAGLGGGSSAAAGMMAGLRELFGLTISDTALTEMGSALGADVAFAVHALLCQHAAIATGIGDAIEPLPKLKALHLALILPQGSCPTGQVYNAFDTLPGDKRSPDELESLRSQWQAATTAPGPLNDLTEPAIAACPAVGHAIATLASLNHRARVTGSGSTVFVLAENAQEASRIVRDSSGAGLIAVATSYNPRSV